jgi:hypothetical protein
MLGTQEGRSYTQGEITEMMTSAGLKDVERLPFRAPNDSGIITGVK